MKRVIVIFMWYFLAYQYHYPIIGPFASLEQCNAIRRNAQDHSDVSMCWDDGRK